MHLGIKRNQKLLNDPFIFYYLGFPAILLLLTIIFLDRKTLQSLFWLGLIWGSGFSTLIIVIADNCFHLLRYQHASPFTFFGSPVLLHLAWAPAILMFLHFLPNRKISYAFYAYILIFSFMSSIIDEIFHQIGLLKYIHWNSFVRFVITLPYYYFLAVHYLMLKSKGALAEDP
jgi:hypothetical protein